MGSAHGFVVGGGVAFLPSTEVEAVHLSMMFSYGNMSRGHVPIMLLSKALLGPAGFAGLRRSHLVDSVIGAEFTLH
jgi:hypothetical protein